MLLNLREKRRWRSTALTNGQGTSLAIVGAYVLASKLALHSDPAQAFVSYERFTRPFVEANQDLAVGKNAPSLLARTQEALDARNQWLTSLVKGGVPTSQDNRVQEAHNSLRLPSYEC